MMDYPYLRDCLSPVDIQDVAGDRSYEAFQFGEVIDSYTRHFPDLEQASIVLLGIDEQRGSEARDPSSYAPDAVRKAFYELYHWHEEIKIADIGNIRQGATLNDTYAAARTVIAELLDNGKTVIIIGGSHDLTLPQYEAYATREKIIEATIIDAKIDLRDQPSLRSDSFLMEMFTARPNFLRHYNHIGFQSYFVQPHLLETLDKLRFDCYRVGYVQENTEDMEPVLRHSDMLSIDINAIRHSDGPANRLSPNGFFGDEICTLTRYAGLSSHLNSIGIYGYLPELDEGQLTANQIAQMIWYFIEGRFLRSWEAQLTEREAFLEFHVSFTDVETLFLKSKRTGRWWMQLPDQQFIPCAYKDYLTASNNEIPERWLRAQERIG